MNTPYPVIDQALKKLSAQAAQCGNYHVNDTLADEFEKFMRTPPVVEGFALSSNTSATPDLIFYARKFSPRLAQIYDRAEIVALGEESVSTNISHSQRFEQFCELIANRATAATYITPSAATAETLKPDTQASSLELPLEDEFPWIEAAYSAVSKGHTRQALQAIYWGVESLLETDRLPQLNKVLGSVKLDKLSPEIAAALLRATSRGKKALPGWPKLLLRVKSAITTSNAHSSAEILIGLTTP